MRAKLDRSSEAGFTVLELLVTSVIMVAVMTLVLTAVETNANLSRIQTDVSDVQQSVRVAQREMQRMARMVGRGGLPKVRSLEIEQNVDASTVIGTDTVVEETDVLTLRGALRGPIYRLNDTDATTFVDSGDTATLIIDSFTASGYEQPLDALHELVDESGTLDAPEGILLVGRQGDTVYALTELASLTFEESDISILNRETTVERATLTLNKGAGGGTHVDAYSQLNQTPGTFPAELTSVIFAAIIEEYRYFIREDFSIPGDPSSPPSPKLARVRMMPGTDTVHPGIGGSEDIADNIFDLQVAVGVDADGDGRVESKDEDGNPLATDADEWVWNDEADDVVGMHFPDDFDLTWAVAPMHHVRLSVLGQTQSPDRQYVSTALDSIENGTIRRTLW